MPFSRETSGSNPSLFFILEISPIQCRTSPFLNLSVMFGEISLLRSFPRVSAICFTEVALPFPTLKIS